MWTTITLLILSLEAQPSPDDPPLGPSIGVIARLVKASFRPKDETMDPGYLTFSGLSDPMLKVKLYSSYGLYSGEWVQRSSLTPDALFKTGL